MDQMFGDENFPVMRDFGAMVGNAVMRCPQAPPLYRARVAALYENVLLKEDWPARVTAEGKRVQNAIAAKDGRWAKEYEGQINDARGKVTRRIAAVGRQIGALPKPVVFDANGALKIAKGWSFEGTGGGQGDEMKLEGRDCLHLLTPAAASPSWRLIVHLDAGKYRFEALARTRGVAPVEDEKGRGAGLRISGSPKRANALEGDSAWKPVSYEFETPGGDIPLVVELRAMKGEVWFARDSLQIVKAK